MTPAEYKELLEVKNKLSIALYGLERIKALAEDSISEYIKAGRDGTAASSILSYVDIVLDNLKSKPGEGS